MKQKKKQLTDEDKFLSVLSRPMSDTHREKHVDVWKHGTLYKLS